MSYYNTNGATSRYVYRYMHDNDDAATTSKKRYNSICINACCVSLLYCNSDTDTQLNTIPVDLSNTGKYKRYIQSA